MKKIAKATQDFVPIQEIRDGIVVLKNRGLRMVLMASALNFALKSQEEQMSIIYQFQNFLNSLDFSLQICIRSTRLDIRPYILTLEERLKEQTNDLMKTQTREYIEFIRSFNDTTNVMTKNFFLVIPYDQNAVLPGSSESFLDKLQGKKKNKVKELETFEEVRSQLEQRASVVAQGLKRIGVRVVRLGTEELIELYFKIFNPSELSSPQLSEQSAL